MAKKISSIQSFKCPRCFNKEPSQFRRGNLTNDSTFLPREDRGKQRAVKIPVRCLFCGYTWRSTSAAIDLLMEEPNVQEKVHS